MDRIDRLFEDLPVLGIPDRAEAYALKAPGHQDGANQGDWCTQ